MSGKPQLSVLIPWYERDELRLTLAANEPFFQSQQADVLLLNCGGDSGRVRDLILASETAGVRQVDISAARFNKSLALNIGISESKSDIVLILDTDIVLLDDALAAAQTSLNDQSFVTIEWVHESRPPVSAGNPLSVAGKLGAALVNTAILEFTFPDGKTIHYQASRRNVSGNMRAGPGILLARKQDLVKVQGYNSNLETWGWEDDDILVRLQYVLGLRRIQTGAALHLTHGDNRRALHAPGDRAEQLNFFKCCRNYNNGQFLGTYDSNVAWAIGKLTESTSNAGPFEPRTVPVSGPDHRWSVPEDCVNQGAAPGLGPPVFVHRPPSLDELLLEANLKKRSLQNCAILLVEIGNSRLASRLTTRCGRITEVSTAELDTAKGAYDIIVDCNLTNDVCCLLHWRRRMRNYVEFLAPAGLLLTSREGINLPSTGRSIPSEDDLARMASEFGLLVSQTGYGVYALSRRQPSS